MKSRKCAELKRISRENLTGNYRTAMGAFITILFISMIIDLPFSSFLYYVYSTKTQIAIYYICEALISIIVGVLQIGLVKMHLAMAQKKPFSKLDIYYCFKNNSNRYFSGAILYFIFEAIALCPFYIANEYYGFSMKNIGIDLALTGISLLLLLIIKVLFPFFLYILIERDDLSVTSCLKEALQMAITNLGRLIYVYLSFIGMGVLAILSLGIGLLWIEPYYEQTMVNLYLDICEKIPNPEPIFEQRV